MTITINTEKQYVWNILQDTELHSIKRIVSPWFSKLLNVTKEKLFLESKEAKITQPKKVGWSKQQQKIKEI